MGSVYSQLGSVLINNGRLNVGLLTKYKTWMATRNFAKRSGLESSGDCLYVAPNVSVSIDRATVEVNSHSLAIGKCWPGIGPLPSVFKMASGSTLRVTGNFDFYTGCFITINEKACLTVGKGYLNYRGTIECFDSITLGQDVVIGPDVVIRDSDNHSIVGGRIPSAPIEIGDHVWIGQRAMILKGVSIGDGAIVSAGAIVTRDVQPHTVVAGVPAKTIRENIEWW